MSHTAPVRSCGLAVLVLLSACVPTSGLRVPEPLAMASPVRMPAPAVWQRVRLQSVSGSEVQAWSGPHPVDVLGAAIEDRIGEDDDRPVVLRVENVRTALVSRPTVSSPGAMTLGLGAEFVLVAAGGGEKRLAVEHSINIFESGDRDSGMAYAQLVDDICDRLLNHPEAVEFLGGDAPVHPADSALARQPVPEVGPVIPAESSKPGVEGSGRILWGHIDSSSNRFGNLMLGDMKGILVGMASRDGSTSSGLGRSMSVGLGAVRAGEGSSSITMMMVHLGVGLDVGFSRTVHDDEGYVLRPGVTLALAPEATVDMMMGTMQVPTLNGTTITQTTATITTTMGNLGGLLSADIPFGSAFGIRAGYFLGMSFGTMKSSVGPDVSLPRTVVQYPSFDAYLQTSTGRTSLGLGFQALASAASSKGQSFTKNPMIIFTFEEQVGRGVAYSKSDVSMAGVGVHHETEVLSTPRSAFAGEGISDALASDPSSALHSYEPLPGHADPAPAQPAAKTAVLAAPAADEPPAGAPESTSEPRP